MMIKVAHIFDRLEVILATFQGWVVGLGLLLLNYIAGNELAVVVGVLLLQSMIALTEKSTPSASTTATLPKKRCCTTKPSTTPASTSDWNYKRNRPTSYEARTVRVRL